MQHRHLIHQSHGRWTLLCNTSRPDRLAARFAIPFDKRFFNGLAVTDAQAFRIVLDHLKTWDIIRRPALQKVYRKKITFFENLGVTPAPLDPNWPPPSIRSRLAYIYEDPWYLESNTLTQNQIDRRRTASTTRQSRNPLTRFHDWIDCDGSGTESSLKKPAIIPKPSPTAKPETTVNLPPVQTTTQKQEAKTATTMPEASVPDLPLPKTVKTPLNQKPSLPETLPFPEPAPVQRTNQEHASNLQNQETPNSLPASSINNTSKQTQATANPQLHLFMDTSSQNQAQTQTKDAAEPCKTPTKTEKTNNGKTGKKGSSSHRAHNPVELLTNTLKLFPNHTASRKELMEKLKKSNKDAFRLTYIQPALQQNIIEIIHPADNKLTKYKLLS
jgi:hypothetical protein